MPRKTVAMPAATRDVANGFNEAAARCRGKLKRNEAAGEKPELLQ